MSSLATLASVQLNSIYALVLREILTRYGRHNIGFLWLFAEPMLFTLGVATLWHATMQFHGMRLPILGFAVTGYSSVIVWRNCAGRCAGAVKNNLALLYHRNVTAVDLYFARIFLELAGATASAALLICAFILVGLMEPPADLALMLGGWCLLSLFGAGLGLTVGTLSEMTEIVERVWHVLTYLLFPLSGAAYLLDWMPQQVQKYLVWLPMIHGVEMLRHGYYGDIIVTHESPTYLFAWGLGLLVVGLLLARRISRELELS